jgi:hypothetical protein
MNLKDGRFLVLAIVLVLANLACGAGLGSGPDPTPDATPTRRARLGEEQRADEYGFVFRPIPNYKVDTSFGMQMLAAGADPDTGPVFMLVGGKPLAEGATAETLMASLKSDEIELEAPKPISVAGVSGLVAGLTRAAGNLSGRIVAVMVKPDQQFVMFAMAPKEQWDAEGAALFEAVLGSVKFVEVRASSTEVAHSAAPLESKPIPTAARVAATKVAANPEVSLEEERHSDEGGFTYKVIPDYAVTDADGQVQMLAPDGDADLGPQVLMMAQDVSFVTTPEDTLATLATDDLTISAPQPVTVGGAEGVVANLTRQSGAGLGRLAVVTLSDTRQFVMIGSAPKARWESELAGPFQALLDTITFFEPLEAGRELRQWASSATASSAFGSSNWAAAQATGEPNVAACGDNDAAWASAGRATVEWLELTYATAVIPTGINIHQTYNPGQIVKVEVLDTAGTYHLVYTAEPKKAGTCPAVLAVPVVAADYTVVGVRLTVDQTMLKSWGEIDAVELVGAEPVVTDLPVFWRISIPAASPSDPDGQPPGGLATDVLNTLFLANGRNGLYRYDVEGNLLKTFSVPFESNVTDVAVGQPESIVVTDSVYKWFITLAYDGSQVIAGGDEFGRYAPSEVAVSPVDGNIYVLDETDEVSRLRVYTSATAERIRDLPLAPAGYHGYRGLAFDAKGDLYTIALDEAAILKIDPVTGEIQATLGYATLSKTVPCDLALDAAGNIYVLANSSKTGNAVFVLDAQGNLIQRLGQLTSDGSDWVEGTFFFPVSIAVTADGRFLFICESGYLTAYQLE